MEEETERTVINVSMKTRDEEDKKVTPSWPIMMKAV
jgi:hypothetical protein